MARRRRSFFSQFRSLTRNIKTIFTTLAGLGVLGTIGYFSWPGLGDFFGTPEPQETPNIVVALEPKSDTEIKIATFNIQNFGKSQLEKPEVMATLAQIAVGFDVLAIQEISNKNGNALDDLVSIMNRSEPGRFDYLVSPLLGKNPNDKGSDTEQFGFIYDRTRIELADKKNFGFVLSAKKFKQKFNRLPVVSSFKVVDSLAENPFTFSLVTFHNVHDGHERWKLETENIKDAYLEVRSVLGAEDDIILLGDFNANHEKIMGSLSDLPQTFGSAVTVENTNVKQTKSYDNLVFDASLTKEFIDGHVFDFSEVCKTYESDPKDVSDHFPVFASFGVEENKKVERVAAK